MNKNELIFIGIVTDATGREYKGCYNNNSQSYTLIYLEGTDREFTVTKHTSDIQYDLYDAFTELKAINTEI